MSLQRKVSIAIVALAAAVSSWQAAAVPPGPLCDHSKAYIAQGQPTQLSEAEQGTGASSFVNIGPASAIPYNAIAYNPVDHYLYGVRLTTPRNLLRIGLDGTVTDLGVSAGGAVAAAFGPDGRLYLPFATSIHAVSINDDTFAVQTIPLTGSGLGNIPTDITLVDGYFWGSPAAHTLVRIDPATGATATFTVSGMLDSSGPSGAAWTYGNGNIGISNNGSGVISQIDIANAGSATPTFSLVAQWPGPANSNNDGTACEVPPADLQIVKTGPAAVTAGGSVSWQLTVTNNGPNLSSGFIVRDSLPAGYTAISAAPGCQVSGNSITCVGGELDPTETAVITVTATAPASSQCLTNTGAVLGNDAEPAGAQYAANNTSSAQTCIVAAPTLQLDKALGNAREQDSDQFTVEIRSGSAGGPVVSATANATTLGAGASVTAGSGTTGAYTPAAGTTYYLTESAAGTTTLSDYSKTITCTDASGTQSGLPNNAPFSGSFAITPLATALIQCVLTNTALPRQVSLTKTADTSVLTPNGTIVYTVTASNVGAVAAPNTVIADPVPAGIAALSWSCAASGGAVCPNASGSGALNETIATFPGGAQLVYTLTATVSATPPASVTNTATLSPPAGTLCEPGDTAPPCSAFVAVPPVPQVSLTKTANTATLTPGGTVVYTVTASNLGTVAAPNAVVADPLPAGIIALSWSCAASGGAVCPNASGSGALNETIATFPGGAQLIYTLTATVSATPPPSSTNTASLSPPAGAVCEPDDTAPPCTAAVTLTAPAQLALSKTDGQTSYAPGSSGSYTITITITGASTAGNVGLSDNLPAGLTIAGPPACAATGAAVCGTLSGAVGGNSVSMSGGSIPSAAGDALTIQIPVNFAASMTADPLVNTATATADGTPPVSASDSDTLQALADLSLVKTGPVSTAPGSSLTYTLVVSNAGPATAIAVNLADPTPAGLNFVSASAPCAGGFPCALGDLASGATVTVTVTYAVPANFSGPVPIVNSATVSATTPDPTPANNSSATTTGVAMTRTVPLLSPAVLGLLTMLLLGGAWVALRRRGTAGCLP